MTVPTIKRILVGFEKLIICLEKQGVYNMAIQYRLLENGNGIQFDENGRPLVFDDEKEDEKEFGLDAIHLFTKIPALQAEAKTYREEKDAYKSKLDAFDGLSPEEVQKKLNSFIGIDPEKAKKALATVSNLDQLDKERNIEVEKLKAGVAEAYEAQMKDLTTAYTTKIQEREQAIERKDGAIRRLLIKGAFDRSGFLKDHTVIPAEMAYNTFGANFSIEEKNGNLQVYAVRSNGDKILSMSKPGDPASPEEAIEVLINEYQYKDDILKTNQGGSGAGGNVGSDATKRQQLQALAVMSPSERLKALRR